MAWDQHQVKALRKKLGVTQSEFARMLGCRQQTVSEWELGMYVPANAYSQLLEKLLADADHLTATNAPGVKRIKSPEVSQLTREARTDFEKFFKGDISSSEFFDPTLD